jgi:hypothetical protein
MNKLTSVVALALCVGLSGCMTTQTVDVGGRKVKVIEPSFVPSSQAFDPHNPVVFMVHDLIVIDQEPLRPTTPESDGTYVITFYVRGPGQYTFPDAQAIQTATAGAPTFNCTLVRPTAISCWFNPNPAYKTWKYSVTVKNDKGEKKLDPSVAMD